MRSKQKNEAGGSIKNKSICSHDKKLTNVDRSYVTQFSFNMK